MEEYKYIKGGEVIAIPLFLSEDEGGKLKKEDSLKQFAFARAITEIGGAQIIEVFNKTGDLHTDVDEILKSGRLMKPLYTIWEGSKEKKMESYKRRF
ncbi:hypothetical protein [Tenacibaculum sp.]|uniref:hypothetical protein n=1 Tax=Tenacibaculum sp. TaxID=1906242 RepID=UPI003AA8FDC9